MAEVKKVATRVGYGEALVELGSERDDFLVLDADLAAATQTGMFKKAFPERFYDCGIAEGNMISIAAGIAATGKKVICSSFAMFAAGRAFEQVRNSVGYPHLNVIIGATHAGISVGEDGATHQCCEDIALMRTIPGMTIINPADETEAKKAVKAALELDGPVYMRFGRLAVPVIFGDDYNFEVGKGVELKDGTDVTVIATGLEDDTIPTNKPVSGFGTFAGKYVKPVTPNISLKTMTTPAAKPSEINIIPGSSTPTGATAPMHSIQGITSPGDIRSNVTEKPIKIPDFLQKK